MKVLVLTVLFALSFAAAQLDLELGYEMDFSGGASAPYALMRYSLPLGSEVFGQQVFVLPEVGAWLTDPVSGYVRAQVLLDGDYATWLLDCRLEALRRTCRVGVRLGF